MENPFPSDTFSIRSSFTYLTLFLVRFPTECEVLTIPGILSFLFKADTEQNPKLRVP